MNHSIAKLKCCKCDKVFGYVSYEAESMDFMFIKSITNNTTRGDYLCIKFACCEECAKDLLNDEKVVV